MSSGDSEYLGKLKPIVYRLPIVNAALGDCMIRYNQSKFLCKLRRKIKISHAYTGSEGNWNTNTRHLDQISLLGSLDEHARTRLRTVDTSKMAQSSCVD